MSALDSRVKPAEAVPHENTDRMVMRRPVRLCFLAWPRFKFRLLRQLGIIHRLGMCLFCGIAFLAVAHQLPMLAILFVGLATYVFGKKRTIDTEYGQSRWAGLSDLIRLGFLYRRRGILVGRVSDGRVTNPFLAWEILTKTPREADEQAVRTVQGIATGRVKKALIAIPESDVIHLSVYGRSNSGKSTGSAITNLLVDPNSVIVTDVKPELALATAAHRAKTFGQEIVCIAPMGGAPPGFPVHSFNPFSITNLNSPNVVSDALHFAKALVRPEKQDQNPFFVKTAILVLDAVLSFLFCHAIPAHCTLQKLRELTVDPDSLRNVAEIMRQSNAAGGCLCTKGAQLLSLTGKTLMDVLATLNSQMFWLDSPAIVQSTQTTSFDIQKLLTGQMSCYLIFPTNMVEDYGALIRVWITAFAQAIFAAGIGRPHLARFYFDEASLLGQDMPVLERMLTKGRAFGIRTNFYWQSVHQIRDVFPEHQAQVFREQMSFEQFLEISNYESAKEISQWIGQTTVRVPSWSQTHGWSSSETNGQQHSRTGGSSSSATQSWQKTGRALIQPEELLQLPKEFTVILKPQCPPILARKLMSYCPRDRAEILAMPSG